MAEMTPEQRFEKIERTLEWVTENQARFMTDLERSKADSQARFVKIESTLEWVTENQARFTTELAQMKERHDRAYRQGRRMVLALLRGIRRSEVRLRAEIDARMKRHLDEDHQ
jgi:hypothetical protein